MGILNASDPERKQLEVGSFVTLEALERGLFGEKDERKERSEKVERKLFVVGM